MARPEKKEALTFLFTDIEASTNRWERFPEAMLDVVRSHDALLAAVVADHGGVVQKHMGDGLIASFTKTSDAVLAAVAAQIQMSERDWSVVDGLNIRVAVHRGDVILRDGELFGWALNFASRLNAIGHGRQILISEAARDSLQGDVDGVSLVSLGHCRLRDIAEPTEVFQVVAPDLDREFPPLRNATRHLPLPKRTKSIVGREEDLAQTLEALRTHRLVTIVGPTGVGASTLALAVADEVAPEFGDGVVRCDLAGVDEAGAVQAIATAFGVWVRQGEAIERSVTSWMRDQRMLLVMEHCDRSVEAAGRLVELVLADAPNASVLCTSSRPLGIDGEYLQRLRVLSIDSAVELFCARAEEAGSDIEDSRELRTLCERLDRMPLAIEVAAANAVVSTVAELSEMLARSELSDAPNSKLSLDLMREAVSLGVEALSPSERSMLTAAAAFAAPFDRSAFFEVCAPGASAQEAGQVLTMLVDRSLLGIESGEGRPLFRLFESVAEYVRGQADPGELEQANARFVQGAVDFVQTSAVRLRGPSELLTSRRVRQQFGNVRGAFERSLASGDLRSAALISTELWDYGLMRMSDEYFRWSERVLAAFRNGDEALLGPVSGVAALGAWIRDDLDSAIEWSNEALRLESEHGLEFDLPARQALINATVYSGAGAAPPILFKECADYQRGRPERYFHVNVEVRNALMSVWMNDPSAATRRAIRAVKMARESENPSTLSFALWALGVAVEPEDPLHATALLGESLEIARDVDNHWCTALAQMALASVQRRTRSPEDAVPVLLDLVDLLWRVGHTSHLWATLRLCGLVLGDLGEDEIAMQLHHVVDNAHMAMPALPADAAVWDQRAVDLISRHDDDWGRRAELDTRTWTTLSTVNLVRASLEKYVVSV